MNMLRILGGLLLAGSLLAIPAHSDTPYIPPENTSFGASYVPVEVPILAPPVAFKTEDGQDTGLIEMRGQVLLVNFWATWCPPCIGEMPIFDQLTADYGADGFKVVALSQDIDPSVIRPFYERIGLKNIDVYHDEGRIFAAVMAIPGTPSTVLVDRDGKVVGAVAGVTDWDSAEARALIEHYLAQPAKS